jgi:hypothetical protein
LVHVDDLRKGKPFTDKLEHALHRNPLARTIGLAKMDLRADSDALFPTCPRSFQAVYFSWNNGDRPIWQSERKSDLLGQSTEEPQAGKRHHQIRDRDGRLADWIDRSRLPPR